MFAISNQKCWDDVEHDVELGGFFWNLVEILSSEDGTRALGFLNNCVHFNTNVLALMLT